MANLHISVQSAKTSVVKANNGPQTVLVSRGIQNAVNNDGGSAAAVPSSLAALSPGIVNTIANINSGVYRSISGINKGGPGSMMSNASSPPTGLTVYRNGETFKCSWKLSELGYELGQEFKYSVNGQKFVSVSISSTQTSITLKPGRGISTFTFCVRGRARRYIETKTSPWDGGREQYEQYENDRIYGLMDFGFRYTPSRSQKNTATLDLDWSEWAEYTWNIDDFAPAPEIEFELKASNSGEFSWNAEGEETGKKVIEGILWQSIYVHNAADGADLDWKNCEKGQSKAEKSKSSGSKTYVEPSATDGGVRWLRAASLTPIGYGEWVYENHAYAIPHPAQLKSASAKAISTGVMNITTNFTINRNNQYPIDSVITQFAKVKPGPGCSCPAGASWSDGLETAPLGNTDKHSFNAEVGLGYDECIFVRVLTKHDENIGFSQVLLALKGKLSTPGTPSANVSVQNGTATITADNHSGVSDAFLAVYYRSVNEPKAEIVVGIIAPGLSRTTVIIPELKTVPTYTFGVRAIVGSYKAQSRSDGMSAYKVTALMTSDATWVSGVSARPPANVAAALVSPGTVRVTWDWSWSVATSATLAWADHEDAWESTSEPQTYDIQTAKVTAWNISDLEMGKTYWVRVRLNQETDEGDTIIGPWCDAVEVDLGSAPRKPILEASRLARSSEQSVTLSWSYESTDDTEQTYAEVIECEVNGLIITNGSEIAHAESEHGVTITPDWGPDSTHYLRVRTMSESGHQSEWSDPVSIYTVAPLEARITGTSLRSSLTEDDGVPVLAVMPLSVTVAGAGTTGIVSVSIIRDSEYHIFRPDNSVRDGYEGETIASYYQVGDGEILIGFEALLGSLDDGAQYKIVATVSDDYGQSSSAELPFRVEWRHKAGLPKVEVEADFRKLISKIKVTAPANYQEGDVVDIYRLSADKPELIVSNGQFGQTYVDPYSAFGVLGGHRIVAKSANDDYVTEDGQLSWIDTTLSGDDYIGETGVVIDFGGLQLTLPYNNSIGSSWKKDFERTVYLGGAVHGDWNPGVTRDMTITCDATRRTELDTIALVRRLAEYTGICHVRTPEGSSFDADIQVSENTPYDKMNVTFDFAIQKIDPQGYAGVTLEEWTSKGGTS